MVLTLEFGLNAILTIFFLMQSFYLQTNNRYMNYTEYIYYIDKYY